MKPLVLVIQNEVDDPVALVGQLLATAVDGKVGPTPVPEIDSEIFSSWAATDDELAKLDHTIDQACEQVAAAEAELIKTWKPAFQAWAQLVKDQQAKAL
jgi:hypothetical protein